jgi:DNA-binding NarL/FixJ family response regulator
VISSREVAQEVVSEDGGHASLVVVDRGGAVFAMLRELRLEIGLWRTLRAPERSDLTHPIVVLYVLERESDWDEIARSSEIWPTVVFATHPSPDDAAHALGIGAFGYIESTLAADGLRRTLLGALRGEPAFSRELLGRWLRETKNVARFPRPRRTDRLTTRQREIIRLIAAGATDKEISTALGIRKGTAQKHVANLLRRLGVPNRAGAVGFLLRDGTHFQAIPSDTPRR